MIRKITRRLRRLVRIVQGKDILTVRQKRLPMLRLGSDYGGWYVIPNLLSTTSVVYSMGIGEDMSFDVELIQRFGVTVHGFDPTPRSVDWVKSQSQPHGFHFHEYGVASYDGVASFQAAVGKNWVSRSMHANAPRADTVQVPVKRLSTILTTLGHEKIDLLKMDIEGAECQVIHDLLRSDIRPVQLLVEFHHRFDYISLRETRDAITALNESGYRIFFISDTGEEYGFVFATSLPQSLP